MKIALVGDVMLGRLVNEILKENNPAYPWGDILPLLKSVDYRICNLECVISDKGNPWSLTPKMFHFRTDEKNIESLKAAQIEMVSIANNHILDYEEEALIQMIKILDQNQILHAGSGQDIKAAETPAICTVNSQKIGLFAITDNESGWEASGTKPGLFYFPIDIRDKRAKHLFDRVNELKKSVDYVIVSAHWGPNWGYKPPKVQIPFAHALIDSGADLIFGHSGHIFRGIEIYKEKPIIYCAGDFVDDYAVDEIERNDESFIFVLEIENAKTQKIFLYPTYIAQFQARLATGFKKDSILSKMQKLCQEMNTEMTRENDYGIIHVAKTSDP